MKKNLIMSLAVLTIALATSTVMGTGCPQPTTDNGGYEQENPNQGGQQQGGEQQGGNQQGNTGSYAQPTTRNLANGYTIRNFSGSHTFGADTIVDATEHYLGEAETYIKDSAGVLFTMLKSRNAATQNYFNNYLYELRNNMNYQLGSGNSFDMVMNGNSNPSISIFEDIVRNLDHKEQGYAFRYGYKFLANESYKEGLGQYSNMSYYQQTRDDAIDMLNTLEMNSGIDFTTEANSTSFPKTTQLMNEMLAVAANNMNSSKNLDLTADDLRQFINIAMTSDSLLGMHERTKANLGHTGTCSAGLAIGNIDIAMQSAVKQLPAAAVTTYQDQGMER